MTVLEIIEEIRRLPSEERIQVLNFARQRPSNSQLSGDEIAALAQRMVEATDSNEVRRLEDEIVRGFYGNEPHV
jgi:hypothetical protein